jgi:hypothetical protein
MARVISGNEPSGGTPIAGSHHPPLLPVVKQKNSAEASVWNDIGIDGQQTALAKRTAIKEEKGWWRCELPSHRYDLPHSHNRLAVVWKFRDNREVGRSVQVGRWSITRVIRKESGLIPGQISCLSSSK